MFAELWDIMYRWFWLFLQFAKNFVDIVSSPVSDIIINGLNFEEGSFFETVFSSLTAIVGDMSLIEVMFGVGIPFYIAFVIVKFFVDLVA